MSDLLKQIYQALQPINASPKHRETAKILDGYYGRVEKALGRKFVNDLWQATADAWGVESDDAFALGFRIGGQLVLEALSKYSS